MFIRRVCYNGYVFPLEIRNHFLYMQVQFIIDKKYDRQFVRGKKSLQFFTAQYKVSRFFMEATLKLYQKSWDEINDAFSNYIARETGYNWFYDAYKCVLSPVHVGIANWGREPIIVRAWQETSYTQRRITAHELVISHYFEIYRRHYAHNYPLTDGQVWALAEIAAFALTSLPRDIRQFWPWDSSGYYTDHNYPQIVPFVRYMGGLIGEFASSW